MTTAPERLYGIPGAENLQDDLGAAYELLIEPWVDEGDRTPRVIEEWSVHPAEYPLPTVEHIVEWMVERSAEDYDDDGALFEHLEQVGKQPEVQAAVEALRAAFATRITWRIAHRRVAEHTVTWDAEDEPLVNGERLYRPVDAS